MILKNSKNAWYYLNQGLTAVYYNQFKKAVSKFNKAISLEPENTVALLHKGRTLYKMENFQNAVICFDNILSIDPKSLDALYNKGLALEKIEKYEDNKHKITVTMYHPVSRQTDDTPNITADGTVIRINNASEYKYVAVSQNMLIRVGGFLNFGDYIWLDAGKKSGVYQVRDVMNKRFINRVDILETPGTRPYKYSKASMRRISFAYNDF